MCRESRISFYLVSESSVGPCKGVADIQDVPLLVEDDPHGNVHHFGPLCELGKALFLFGFRIFFLVHCTPHTKKERRKGNKTSLFFFLLAPDCDGLADGLARSQVVRGVVPLVVRGPQLPVSLLILGDLAGRVLVEVGDGLLEGDAREADELAVAVEDGRVLEGLDGGGEVGVGVHVVHDDGGRGVGELVVLQHRVPADELLGDKVPAEEAGDLPKGVALDVKEAEDVPVAVPHLAAVLDGVGHVLRGGEVGVHAEEGGGILLEDVVDQEHVTAGKAILVGDEDGEAHVGVNLKKDKR